jgi:hypothetical protein
MADNFKWFLWLSFISHPSLEKAFSVDKIKVYVYSLKGVSPVEYVDMESARHACSQAGERVFTGLKNLPLGHWDSWDSILPEAQREVVHLVRELSEVMGLEFEIIDLADCGMTTSLKSFVKRISAPSVAFKGEVIKGAPTREELKTLLRR